MEENKYKDDEQVKENIRKYKEDLVKSELDIDKKEVKEDKTVLEYKEKETINEDQTESNNNNNYCTNCGTKLRYGINFCTKCGYKINQSIVINKINPEDNNNISLSLCSLSAICLVMPSIILGIFSNSNSVIGNTSIIFPLIGLILMIIARVKYPTYTFGKVLMWIYISIVFLVFTFLLIISIMCSSLIYSCA